MPSVEYRSRNRSGELPASIRLQIDAFRDAGNAILYVTEASIGYKQEFIVWHVPHTAPGFDLGQARFYFKRDRDFILAQHSPDLTKEDAEAKLTATLDSVKGNVDAPEIQAAGFTIFHSEVISFG